MEEKKNPNTANDIVQDFLGTSSLTGAPHLVTNNCRRKCFWLVVLIVMFIGFFANMSASIGKYLSHPTITKSRTKFRNFRFPDVTLCSGSSFLEYPRQPPTNARQFWSVAMSSVFGMDEITANERAKSMALASSRDYLAGDPNLARADFFIKQCAYRGTQCKIVPTGSFNPYGCVTIQPNTRELGSSDGSFGLSLILTFSSNMFSLFSSSESESLPQTPTFKMMFHGEDSAPDFSKTSASINLIAGKLHNINLHMQEESVDTNCQESKNDSLSVVRSEIEGNMSFIMDKKLCQELAFQENLFQKCGCFDGRKWTPFNKTLGVLCESLPSPIYKFGVSEGEVPSKWQVADAINPINGEPTYVDMNTSDKVKTILTRIKCMETFQLSVQYPTAPVCSKRMCREYQYFVETIYKDYENTENYQIANFTPQAVVKENGNIIVEVSVTKLDSVEHYEESSFTTHDLLSDIGGQIALWISCSLITLVEFIELFVRLLYLGCKRFCRKSTAPDNENVQQTASQEKA